MKIRNQALLNGVMFIDDQDSYAFVSLCLCVKSFGIHVYLSLPSLCEQITYKMWRFANH